MDAAEAKKQFEQKYKDYNWFSPPSYYALSGALGHEKLLECSTCGYQGDTWLLVQDKSGRIGYLTFGWGSCSGCDALQACTNWEDVANLYNDLEASIQWFPDKAAALKYFSEKDWSLDWSWHTDYFKRFLDRAKEVLAA